MSNTSETSGSAGTDWSVDPSPGTTRRHVLIGGAIGLGTAVAAGGGIALMARTGDASTTSLVVARRLGDRVPADDPDSPLWSNAPEARIALDGQVITPPTRPQPSVDAVTVRALHDGETIAFRIGWKDDRADDLTVPVDRFRDACAVLLAKGVGDAAVRVMGTAGDPATILHWKADWQRDVDRGFQDLEAVFPNTAVDFYPPLAPYEGPPSIPTTYEDADATEWLPGVHVGNPVAQAGKASPVEKAVAKGFGTLTTQPTQDARGRGIWEDDGWRVALSKPLSASDEEEVSLSPGDEYACAFAVWAGQDRDAGGNKSPSKLIITLRLDP